MVRLGALGSGAVALVLACAVVFAISKFAKQKLPEEEKVSLPLSAVHSQIGPTLMQNTYVYKPVKVVCAQRQILV